MTTTVATTKTTTTKPTEKLRLHIVQVIDAIELGAEGPLTNTGPPELRNDRTGRLMREAMDTGRKVRLTTTTREGLVDHLAEAWIDNTEVVLTWPGEEVLVACA